MKESLQGDFLMITATIREAKATLNELIDRALRGEEVVLLRGSKHVVTLTPITEDDLELAPRLSDAQAARFWDRIERERSEGKLLSFASSARAAADLKRTWGAKKRHP